MRPRIDGVRQSVAYSNSKLILAESSYNIATFVQSRAVSVASLSAFGGKYILAEASPGCDRCPLSGVGRCPLSEVHMYSIYREVNRGHELCLLYRGCPLFGGSVILEVLLYWCSSFIMQALFIFNV